MTGLPATILVPFEPALAAELARNVPSISVGGLEMAGKTSAPLWVFVDWLLPKTSGLELCRRLRADPKTADARIFLVLEDDDRDSRRRALKAGADDYIVGPLSAAGIQARVCEVPSLPERSDAILTHGLLKLDFEAHQARAGGAAVPMGPNEFRLLSFLMRNRDRVLPRTELIGALKDNGSVDIRTVDVWIGRLRRALAAAKVPDPIRTVRNLGYVYDSY